MEDRQTHHEYQNGNVKKQSSGETFCIILVIGIPLAPSISPARVDGIRIRNHISLNVCELETSPNRPQNAMIESAQIFLM
jgi:hypothetical protein